MLPQNASGVARMDGASNMTRFTSGKPEHTQGDDGHLGQGAQVGNFTHGNAPLQAAIAFIMV